jgi:integrase
VLLDADLHGGIHGAARRRVGGARIERVNLLKGVVDVVESLSEVNGHLHVGPTKTRARRSISLPRFSRRCLASTSAGTHPEMGTCSPRPRAAAAKAKLLPPALQARGQRAGLDERLRFHDLRHPARHCSSRRVRTQKIQERLGHSTIRLTFDRYRHLFPSLDDRLRKASRRHSRTRVSYVSYRGIEGHDLLGLWSTKECVIW